MTLKTFKPYTKTTRGTVLTSREGLWKGKPYKPLTSANNASKGRNNYGRITSRNHGGGHKQKYRDIDFYRTKVDMKAEVERIEYDPNRNAHIALLCYKDGEKRYIIAPKGLKSTGTAEFNKVWSYLGLPCISLPLLQGENNLPLGVQLVGNLYDDHRFLGVANWLEKECNN